MKLIIDIPDALYDSLKNGCGIYPYRLVYEAMVNGTPLEEYDSHSPIDEYDDADGNHCVWFGR